MTASTIERAYELARSGQLPSVAAIKARLKADGHRAVDSLLATRAIQGHLQAICSATSKTTPAANAPLP